jgi:hypothetical protein
MKSAQVSPLVEDQVEVDSTTPVTVLKTEWMLAAGVTAGSCAMEVRAITGSFAGAARARFAVASMQRPGPWGTATTPVRTTAGVWPEAFDFSTTTDQMWVQFGLAGAATAGAAECLARLQAQVQGGGQLVATQTVLVNADTNAGSFTYIPLGKPFAQLGASKLMYAIVWSGFSGIITWRPVYRQFKGNLELPETWGDLGAADAPVSTDGDTNTGLLAISPSAGYMFGQPGIRYSGTARGSLKLIVASVS